MLADAQPQAEAEEDLAVVEADDLIRQAMQNPVGFELPRDQARLERMARLLEHFGQDRILGLSESAEANGISIIMEAYEQDRFNEQIAEMAAGIPLPSPNNVADPL